MSPALQKRSLAGRISLVYAQSMLEEKDFQRKADAAFDGLKKRLLVLGDAHGFDVEGEAGKLEVIFEEPEEAKFVISPNTPVRDRKSTTSELQSRFDLVCRLLLEK